MALGHLVGRGNSSAGPALSSEFQECAAWLMSRECSANVGWSRRWCLYSSLGFHLSERNAPQSAPQDMYHMRCFPVILEECFFFISVVLLVLYDLLLKFIFGCALFSVMFGAVLFVVVLLYAGSCFEVVVLSVLCASVCLSVVLWNSDVLDSKLPKTQGWILVNMTSATVR